MKIRARVTLLPTAEGGRKGPFFSNYRPIVRLGDEFFGAVLDILDGEEAHPGETHEVEIRFFPGTPASLIRTDGAFELCEGRRPVARGTVLVVIDPAP